MAESDARAAVNFLLRTTRDKAGLESLELPGAGGEAPVTDFDALPDAHKNAVEGAAAKLDRPEQMTPSEHFALEAIIIPDRRPAILIADDDYRVTHRDWLHLNDPAVRALITPAIPAIGRLELPDRHDIPYGGTAFLVGPGLLMTNRHVAELFVDGAGRGLSFRPGASAAMNFVEEAARQVPQRYRITSVVLIHPYWDMALLKVADVPFAPLTLSAADPEGPEDEIVVIGYPAFNPRFSRAIQDQVFGGVYDVKRLQPGHRLPRRAVDSFGKSVNASTHDASTLGGNSGSAVVSVRTGQVVGLHFGGAYLDTNYAVPARDLALDAQLVDAGLSFAVPRPAPSGGAWDGWWQGVETPAVVAAPVKPAVAAPAPVATSAGRATASITIPLTITVSLGDLTTPAVTPESVTLERAVMPWHDGDYANRRGYDPDFLGFPIPLPVASDPASLARMSDGATAIPYTHFSIAMHAGRRLALFTASNLRRDPPARGSGDGRDDLGGLGVGDTERWFPDPRLRGIEQLPDRFFTQDRGAFDKGHLVRRADVVWGETVDERRRANGDTFHVTNCSPQVAGFNRQHGTDNWGDLENAVFRQATTQRLTIFAGPVLADDDPPFRGVDDTGPVTVAIPRAFWKVIVAPDGAGIGAYGFLLEQDLTGVATEALRFDAHWRRSMIDLATLEKRIGRLTFPDILHDADRGGTSAAYAIAAAAGIAA
ncbi:DNA/RNA non-specific endonuclease [Sphingomonas mollis]|uniref:Serine protease n=1 Tax=Sphingomonas mollis TaxID=2795726 RepID=A0ABS0XPC5_9SPHN|nr:DNA/RNA non-specific endonuclease [Sphingomonas sp. BT553]MBJ6121862.1 DNA/RNA non-specific endonuclease [Sphingomonas sp. BT553]